MSVIFWLQTQTTATLEVAIFICTKTQIFHFSQVHTPLTSLLHILNFHSYTYSDMYRTYTQFRHFSPFHARSLTLTLTRSLSPCVHWMFACCTPLHQFKGICALLCIAHIRILQNLDHNRCDFRICAFQPTMKKN